MKFGALCCSLQSFYGSVYAYTFASLWDWCKRTKMWIYNKVKSGQKVISAAGVWGQTLSFTFSTLEKKRKTWVGDETAEITRWNDMTDITEILKILACVRACTACGQGACQNYSRNSRGECLCVTARGTMTLSQVYGALYRPHSSNSCISSSLLPFLPLPIAFIWVFYFLNVLRPHLEDKLRLSPQLLWQPPFASEKVHLRGPTKCATTCIGILLH